MRALIDADELILKASVIEVTDLDWETEKEIKRPPTLDEAIKTLESLLARWMDKAGADTILMCFSPDDRILYRRVIFPEYKGGRSEKPEHFWSLVSYVKGKYPYEWRPGLEADDVMGILAGPGSTIISSDKDMMGVPGRIYSPYKDRVFTVTHLRADYHWMYQTLTGDATDGYKGCPRIGPKTADEILTSAFPQNLKGWWGAVQEAFYAKKLSAKDARLQATLAHILRPGEYNEDTGLITIHIGQVSPITLDVPKLIKENQ